MRYAIIVAACLAIGLALAVFAQPQPGGQMTAEQRFAQLDRDGDGRVTAEEAGGAAWFDRLDTDGDGGITLEEARGALAAGSADTGGLAPAAPPMQVHRDLQYAQIDGVDPNLLCLDLYAPIDAANAPVAVWCTAGRGSAATGPRPRRPAS